MNYKDTLNYLFSQLPMYQRTGVAAYKKDIGNIIKACDFLNNPQEKFKSIHIAGTNGKGSTAHLLSSVLQEAGYKTGLYTSPHLVDFRERIKINGKKISEKNVVDFVNSNKENFETINMSFFEYTVAMAFYEFEKEKVDIAIIETGLGGRLDSTNIVNPLLSIITNIGYDHMNLLGDSLEEIAFEKAGIIKENTPVLIGKKQQEIDHVFKKQANKKNASLTYAKKFHNQFSEEIPVYQNENINTVISAIDVLNWNISNEEINSGIKNVKINTGLRGRWEVLSTKPKIVCDTGHNIDGINQVINHLEKIKYGKLHFVFGTVNDKKLDSILNILPKDGIYYFCKAKIDRALDANKLKSLCESKNIFGESYSSVKSALNAAKKNSENEDLILIGGSTFVVAEVL
tara:strand:- start:455 stop:1657 length:1203 start_codon:yes stop_codon:yes gene_type:complete